MTHVKSSYGYNVITEIIVVKPRVVDKKLTPRAGNLNLNTFNVIICMFNFISPKS